MAVDTSLNFSGASTPNFYAMNQRAVEQAKGAFQAAGQQASNIRQAHKQEETDYLAEIDKAGEMAHLLHNDAAMKKLKAIKEELAENLYKTKKSGKKVFTGLDSDIRLKMRNSISDLKEMGMRSQAKIGLMKQAQATIATNPYLSAQGKQEAMSAVMQRALDISDLDNPDISTQKILSDMEGEIYDRVDSRLMYKEDVKNTYGNDTYKTVKVLAGERNGVQTVFQGAVNTRFMKATKTESGELVYELDNDAVNKAALEIVQNRYPEYGMRATGAANQATAVMAAQEFKKARREVISQAGQVKNEGEVYDLREALDDPRRFGGSGSGTRMTDLDNDLYNLQKLAEWTESMRKGSDILPDEDTRRVLNNAIGKDNYIVTPSLMDFEITQLSENIEALKKAIDDNSTKGGMVVETAQGSMKIDFGGDSPNSTLIKLQSQLNKLKQSKEDGSYKKGFVFDEKSKEYIELNVKNIKNLVFANKKVMSNRQWDTYATKFNLDISGYENELTSAIDQIDEENPPKTIN